MRCRNRYHQQHPDISTRELTIWPGRTRTPARSSTGIGSADAVAICTRRVVFPQSAALSLSLILLLFLAVMGAGADREMPPGREDHAVVAVTVDGHVHTLDAWTGNVRGVYADSGGPLVSSSTTFDGSAGGDDEEDNGSFDVDGDGDGSGRGRERDDVGGDGRPPPRHRNALGGGFVVPGLDGVIYWLTDGRLSVLMSYAPDLVLEPRMACLTVDADSDGIVEDESCGLLIGEKTTELFSLDTGTGTAKRIGGGAHRPSKREGAATGDGGRAPSDSAGEEEGTNWTGGDCGPREWRKGDEARQRSSHSNLLLQRDEYVVRALDAATSEELWFVTVAHFSALDLEGRGGPTALTRAKVAAADRAGYTRAVRARSGGDDGMKVLPPPDLPALEGEDLDGWDKNGWASSEGREGVDDISGQESGGGGAGGGSGGCGRRWQQMRRRGRFGEKHADRFPYLLYEDNTWVVAMDPMDGSVLWRREMPSLPVSLYGIRGREWVDIMPPPMSLLQPPSRDRFGSSASFSSSSLTPQAAFDGTLGLDGEEVDWSRDDDEPLLLLTNGESENKMEENAGALSGGSLRSAEVSNSVDWWADSGGGNSDGRSGSGSSSFWESEPGTAVVPAVAGGTGAAEKNNGLLQPGLRSGKQLQAQLGFLNGHFFVSSSLRKSPLHSAAEDPAVAVQDRYPHPTGMASRRSSVGKAGREPRVVGGGDLGSSTCAVAGVGDGQVVSPLAPLVVPTPLHAARPADGSGVRRVATGDRGGVELRTADGDGRGGIGGVRSGTMMRSGDWEQDVLKGIKRTMQEQKEFLSGEEPPVKELGLFLTWRFIAGLAGVVSAIVAGVAYVAYKYGAEAMRNMTTMARKGSTMVRMNGVVPATDGPAADTAAPAEQETVESSQGRPGRHSPLGPASPSLQHAASTSSTLTTSHPWDAELGGGMDPLGSTSPVGSLVLPGSRSVQEPVHIHRVHSLPVLGKSHSPRACADRRRPGARGSWNPVLVSNEALVAASVNGNGRLHRAASAVTYGNDLDLSGSSSGQDSAVESRSRSDPLPHTEPTPLNSVREVGGGNPSGARGNEALSPAGSSGAGESPPRDSTASSGGSSPSCASTNSVPVASRDNGGGGRKGRSSSGSPGAPVEPESSSRGEKKERRRQRQPRRQEGASLEGDRYREQRSRETRRSNSTDGHSDGYSDEESPAEEELEERRRQTSDGGELERRRSKSPRASDGGGKGHAGACPGSVDRRRSITEVDDGREGRKSRSPRSSLEAGGVVVGGIDAVAGVGAGGDTPDALLVTNRRLRTEFVEGQKLGRGGFGTVYKCRNRLDGHDYAIKKIRLSSDPRWQPQLAKVLREVKIMSLLDHPNIVRYYQVRLPKCFSFCCFASLPEHVCLLGSCQ